MSQEFIKTHFAGVEVSFSKVDEELFDKDYKVVFVNGAKVEFTPLDEGDVTKVYRTSTGEELDTEAYRKAYNESTVGEEASPSDVSGSTDMILFILSDGKTVPVYVMGENEFIIGLLYRDQQQPVRSCERSEIKEKAGEGA